MIHERIKAIFAGMGQNKLERFSLIKTFNNVLEYPTNMQGTWHTFFKNNQPIILELACGKGEYAVGLASLHSTNNYIGIDVKGNRIFVGAKKALSLGLSNVAFIRSQIEVVPNYFSENEVSEIWITFPDPQLRWSKMKKRLTHPRFLRLYQQILKADGIVHLKTDSPDLYAFTKAVISLYNLTLIMDIDDVYALENIEPALKIKTHYEGLDIAKSNRIHYLQFSINKPLDTALDEQLKQLFNEPTTN